jgi:hypothetical protein
MKTSNSNKQTASTVSATVRKRPAAASGLPIRLLQVFEQPDQRPFLDPGFEPCNNIAQQADLSQHGLLKRLAGQPEMQQASHWGALAWDFGQRAGMSAQALREHIAGNPGHDLYIVNAHARQEALYHNMWRQAAPSHPHFVALAGAFLKAANLPVDVLQGMQAPGHHASAPYCVATPAFWTKAIHFIDTTIALAHSKLPSQARAMLQASAAPPDGSATSSVLELIAERLFSVYLDTAEGRQFKTHSIAIDSAATQLDVHARLLADMKNVACQQKSAWLAACWVNYRNLYFAATLGDAWVRKNLAAVTPAGFIFPATQPPAEASPPPATPASKLAKQAASKNASAGIPA